MYVHDELNLILFTPVIILFLMSAIGLRNTNLLRTKIIQLTIPPYIINARRYLDLLLIFYLFQLGKHCLTN